MVNVYCLESGEAKSLFETNPWRRDVAQPLRKTIEFKDANGRIQEAALFLPEDTLEGVGLPMVVTIYPGVFFQTRTGTTRKRNY